MLGKPRRVRSVMDSALIVVTLQYDTLGEETMTETIVYLQSKVFKLLRIWITL